MAIGAHELTALITANAGGDEASSISLQQFGFMLFMVDCAVVLNHSVVLGVSQRNLRVEKYRGSAFDENESPFVIGKKDSMSPSRACWAALMPTSSMNAFRAE